MYQYHTHDACDNIMTGLGAVLVSFSTAWLAVSRGCWHCSQLSPSQLQGVYYMLGQLAAQRRDR
jgi:hypothetical protein